MTASPDSVVLVIEDDQDSRESLAGILRDEGYSVVTACDGGQAIEQIRREPVTVCVVLLDLVMPGMNGQEFMAVRAREPALCAVPVVLLSATREDIERAAPGADAYLRKPLDLKVLLELVGRFCATRTRS